MKQRQKDMLASLGITVERYYVDSWPPVWGIALVRDGKDLGVVETHGYHTDEARLRNKYAVRASRSQEDKDRSEPILIKRTQREAVAEFLRREYSL